MADELVISGLTSGAPSVTLAHGINGISGYPTIPYSGIAFLGYTPDRLTEHWQAIDWQGADGVDEKFMGRQPKLWHVKGVIVSRAVARTQRYTDLEGDVNTVLSLSAGQHEFSLSGPINESLVVAKKPQFQEIGINTGPFIFFIQSFEVPKG